MQYETRRVIEEYEREVEAEARSLIQRGTPPLEAFHKARQTVRHRREQNEAMQQIANGGGLFGAKAKP